MSEHAERLEDLKVITEVLEDIYQEVDVTAVMVEEIPQEESGNGNGE